MKIKKLWPVCLRSAGIVALMFVASGCKQTPEKTDSSAPPPAPTAGAPLTQDATGQTKAR